MPPSQGVSFSLTCLILSGANCWRAAGQLVFLLHKMVPWLGEEGQRSYQAWWLLLWHSQRGRVWWLWILLGMCWGRVISLIIQHIWLTGKPHSPWVMNKEACTALCCFVLLVCCWKLSASVCFCNHCSQLLKQTLLQKLKSWPSNELTCRRFLWWLNYKGLGFIQYFILLECCSDSVDNLAVMQFSFL